MIKKSFIGLKTPCLEYEPMGNQIPGVRKVPLSGKATLLLDCPVELMASFTLKEGDPVQTGQKLAPAKDHPSYVISPAAGTVTSIRQQTGDYGKTYAEITIDVKSEDEPDDTFEKECTGPSFELAKEFLAWIPGAPPLESFNDPEKPIKTIVIYGGDNDLLISTHQYIVNTDLEGIKRGIEALKKITGVKDVIMAVPGETMQGYGHIGADVKSVDLNYPAAFPQMIMHRNLGRELPAGKTSEDLGICFLTVESVVSLGKAFYTRRIPLDKLLTVVDKKGSRYLVSAKIGTPLGHILQALDITLEDKDRIILGGPMTGSTIFSDEYPVMPDTGAIMIQAARDISYVSDYPCINCGECIRVCPAKIQVSMLVRFLEAGQYEDAQDLYDLLSCIECGLCAFVCTARIPIFQYIRLGKFELDRIKSAEAVDE